jgi:hypothetical protein
MISLLYFTVQVKPLELLRLPLTSSESNLFASFATVVSMAPDQPYSFLPSLAGFVAT